MFSGLKNIIFTKSEFKFYVYFSSQIDYYSGLELWFHEIFITKEINSPTYFLKKIPEISQK